MAAKSPTLSLKSREIIGVDQFSQRREVFGKHDTVFLPPSSPTNLAPAYDVEPIVTSNHGKTTSNFKRNAPGYSSMRESRNDEPEFFEFRTRKYSDNYTSELNQNDDDLDYRRTMTERTRRLSKLRRDFLTSNLHEPTNESPFSRAGTRASMPAVRTNSIKYKIESPNLYKFPFAEPYATPPPVRKVTVDLGPSEVDGKENEDPVFRAKVMSLPDSESLKKKDHQKMFDELVKRYSPQRKPIDWTIPPTRPRIVDSVPKLNTPSVASIDSTDGKKHLQEKIIKPEDDDVFTTKHEVRVSVVEKEIVEEMPTESKVAVQNGPETVIREKGADVNSKRDSKTSLTELEEKNDEVPELTTVMRQLTKDPAKRPSLDKIIDLTIPDLIDKMTLDGEDLEHNKDKKKVKRKRSFLDKLLGRKKDK